ncbi:MAG: RDD family protein [Steroidobacterales bacterium]
MIEPSPSDAPAGQPEAIAPPHVRYSGFWRRVGAACIDALILGLIGVPITLLFADALVRMATAGRAIGFLIAGGYFVIFNSRIGRGQTLGKRVTGIGVRDLNGDLIGPRQAIWRFIWFGTPYFLNGLFLPLGPDTNMFVAVALGIVLVFIVFWGFTGNLYLLLCNRPSRRLLHDLFARTVVLRLPVTVQPVARPTALVHRWMVACLPLVLLGGIALAGFIAISNLVPRLSQLTAMQARLASLPGVVSAEVTHVVQSRAGKRLHVLRMILRVVRLPVSIAQRTATDQVIGVALPGGQGREEFDAIQVIFIRGVDIGIASWSKSVSDMRMRDQLPPASGAST